MATISFANLSTGFDFTTNYLTVDYGTPFVEQTTEWRWQTSLAYVVQLIGSGFGFTSPTPTGGVVDTFNLDLAPGGSMDLQISGLSLDLTTFATLSTVGLSADAQNDLIWNAVLAGDDTIDLGSAGHVTQFAGDGRTVSSGQSIFAGHDTITGSIGAGATSAVFGDVKTILAGGSVFGGDDTINVSSPWAFGDALTVEGFLSGGDDTLSGAVDVAVGDAYDLLGTLAAGDDLITSTNALGATLVGDAVNVYAGALAEGGNDTIIGSTGQDSIYGDWLTLDPGASAQGGSDLLDGAAGNDDIFGGRGNDTIIGGTGVDEAYGEAGNDLFRLTGTGQLSANETINGGAGTDTIEFSNGGSAYSYDLRSQATSLGSIERLLYRDAASGIANLVLSGAQFGAGVSLTASVIGNDSSTVTDRLTIIVDDATALNLSALVVTNFTSPGEYVAITAGGFANSIIGTSGNDSINGGGGNDVLNGGSGNDTIRGGTQADSVSGGAGNDIIQMFQGETRDSIDGGANTDTLDLRGLTGGNSANVNLLTGLWSTSAGGGTATIVNVENILGGSYDDKIVGSVGANSIDGGGGFDDLRGGAGKDTVLGGAHSDILRVYSNPGDLVAGEIYDGGTGTDTLHVDFDPAAFGTIDINLSGVTLLGLEKLEIYSQYDEIPPLAYSATVRLNAVQFGAGLSLTASIVSLFNDARASESLVVTMGTATSLDLSGLTFTGFADANDKVTFVGDNHAEKIIGTVVDDFFNGAGGNDTLIGGLGNDTFRGGAGTDFMDGGAGIDTLDYSDQTLHMEIVLGDAGLGGLGSETAISIENVLGGSASDKITGDGGNTTFRGLGGNDVIDGKAGSDTADYSDRTLKVAVTLNGLTFVPVVVGGVAEDSIRDIENITGGSAGDALIGDATANRLVGNAGNDTMSGGVGKDVLIGGSGSDRLTGGYDADTFVFNAALGATNIDTITDFSASTDHIYLDNAVMTALGGTPGPLASSQFLRTVVGHAATSSTQRIIYDDHDRTLWYDDDGNGAHAAVQFAVFSLPANPTASNFLII